MRKRRIKFARICVSAALFAVAMVFEHAFKAKWAEIAAVALFSVSYLIVGYDILWRALTNILHGRVFDENFLMTVATVGAVALGELAKPRRLCFSIRSESCFRKSPSTRAESRLPSLWT